MFIRLTEVKVPKQLAKFFIRASQGDQTSLDSIFLGGMPHLTLLDFDILSGKLQMLQGVRTTMHFRTQYTYSGISSLFNF